jgi:phosphoglycerate dehydrogenase-like enzyme
LVVGTHIRIEEHAAGFVNAAGRFAPKAPGHCIDTRKGARLKIGDCYQLSGGEEHMEICSLGVVGAGQMGSGIAQVAARSGFEVVIHDIHKESVQRGMDVITRSQDG